MVFCSYNKKVLGRDAWQNLGRSAGTLSVRKEQSRSVVPAEGNFEEHPYFRVGDRNAGTGIMQFENELRTRDGNVMQQSWVVRAAHGRGLPGRYDQDVYVALMQLIDAKGLPADGWVSFSVYELVELMGKRHSGREYGQVRESLQRLATTSVESKNAFYHKGKKAYITDTFSLLTEAKLAEYESIAGERKDRNRVHLSQYFVDSYRANYLKHIDAGFYFSLSSPIAKRLYRLVDKKRSGRRSWEVELFSLKSRIPLSDYKYVSKIKEKLEPAHEELISRGFLKRVSYRKNDGGHEYAAYEITEDFHAKRAALASRSLTEEELFCIQRVQAEGMARETAEDLVATHGAARVMHYVEALPHQKNIRNPAGWLRKAIESNYELDMPPALFNASHDELLPPDPASGPVHIRGEEAPDADHANGTPSPPPRLRPDPVAEEAWQQIVADVEDRIDVSSLRVWFKQSFGTNLEGRTLSVAVPNTFAKEYIETRFGSVLDQAAASRHGEGARLEVVVGALADEPATPSGPHAQD
jgi:plasmid replication initiation protein